MAPSRPDIEEEYLSQVAHELRGSLNAILGWAELLRGTPPDDASRLKAADTIIRHARQQTWMITELMDTLRLAAGTLKLSLSTFDLPHVVHAAIEAVLPMARAKGVSVTLETDATSGAGTICGDVKRMTQAVTSLIQNAVHFAPDRSVVSVAVTGAGHSVELRVHDDGVGVTPAAMPYVFARSRPAHLARLSPRSTFRSGLALVRDVVAKHGGAVSAESGPDAQGLTLTLSLPLEGSLETLQAQACETGEAALRGPQPHLHQLRVLLVDDEPDAREALTGILQHYGAVVRASSSAADAIEILQQEPFDVLLADIGMPGTDGYDLIRYVRVLESSTASRLPAVAVTAFASDADRQRALAAGYQMHLSKPVEMTALIAALAALTRPMRTEADMAASEIPDR